MDIPPSTLKRITITVEQFQRMATAGIWEAGDRLELIEGEILDLAPIGKDHAVLRMLLTEQLMRLSLERWVSISVGGPLQLGAFTQVQPDVLILKRREDCYRERLPQASDVLLLVEIADTTLQTGLARKLALYACHAVSECWVLGVKGRIVRISQEPAAADYASTRTAQPGEELAPLACPSLKVHLSSLFG